MNSKLNPQNRKIFPVVGLLILWLLLLISPFGHIVAILTFVGWIVIFIVLGLINVQEPPEK